VALADRADITFVGLDEAQEPWDADLEPADVHPAAAPAPPRRQ
jgi:2-dehydro-3-deoxygluconokinase